MGAWRGLCGEGGREGEREGGREGGRVRIVMAYVFVWRPFACESERRSRKEGREEGREGGRAACVMVGRQGWREERRGIVRRE